MDKNVKLNGLRNVKIFQIAVADKSGKRYIYMNPKNAAENSLYSLSGKKQEVKTTTLSKIFLENDIKKCDVLKLDCEGAEYEILLSSKELLRKVKKIILEYHEPKYFNLSPEYSPKKLCAYLMENGFETKIFRDTYYQGIIYAEK